ncbi:extracellular solute-binding protein [Ruminococcaceae bacterium OttesenSCG-928-L11]|nr:extracellular solute-binding protein [Ruminococcaceae bacterium OttesenSCG-928-L11]
MKASKLRVMACLLSSMLVLSLAACGGGGTQSTASSSGGAASSKPASSAAAASSEAPKAEEGDAPLTEITLPIVDEPITVRYWYPMSSSNLGQMKDYGDSEAYIELAKRTNINVEWIHPVGGTELETFNLLFASSDMPDIMFTSTEEGNKYMYASGPEAAVTDGYFLDLTELVPMYAPNYSRLISDPAVGKHTVTDNSVRWGFNLIYQGVRQANFGPGIRQDFLDKAGLDIPVTYDDWYEVLTAFKAMGVEAPMYISPDGLSVTSEFLTGYDVGKAFYQVDGKVKYGPVEDNFNEYLEMMKKWYAEGLIDQSFSIRALYIPDDDLMLNDKVGSCDTFATWCGKAYYPSRGAVNPDFNLVGAPIPVKEEGQVTHLRNPDLKVRSTVMVISAKTKYPTELVQWFDYQYSEEGAFLMSYGVQEGKDGSYYIEDGVPYWGTLITKNPDGLTQSEARTRFSSFVPLNEDYGRIMRARTPEQLAAHNIWTIETSKDDWTIPNSLTMSADDNKKLAGVMGDINTYVQETVVKMIMGTSNTSFEEFRKQINAMGIQDAIDIYQAAMDRFANR